MIFLPLIKHIHLSEVDSTNSYCKEWLLQHELEPRYLLVSATHQLAGRGQRGNLWHSEAGQNLTFSLAAAPAWPADRQFEITMAVALGIVDFLAGLGIEACIKWPNDIYVEHRKLAGILIENQLRGPVVFTVIVGIGLNLNQEHFAFAQARATSVASLLGAQLNVAQALKQCAESVVLRLNTLFDSQQTTDAFLALSAAYHQHLCYKGQSRTFADKNGELFAGSIVGVEPTGRLLVKLSDGELKKFVFKEIEYIFEARI